MKSFGVLAVVAALLASAASFAAIPEDCWKESGLKVVDGEFLLFVDASNMNTAEVLNLLQKAKYSAGLLPMEFPTVTDSKDMMISLKYGTDQTFPVLTRADLMPQANQSIVELQKIPGVSVDCNRIINARPLSR